MRPTENEVIKVLLDHRYENDGWMFVFEIGEALGKRDWQSASVYVPLFRLERGDLVESDWEDPNSSRPRRRHYRATPGKVQDLLSERVKPAERLRRKRAHWRRVWLPGKAHA